jgi:hypothetical protein
MFESDVLQHTDYMGILTTLKKRVENITDVDVVAQVSSVPVYTSVYTSSLNKVLKQGNERTYAGNFILTLMST